MRYFYTITPDDTIPSKSYVDGLLSGLPGGHDAATIGTAGITAGLSITGQEINQQSATAARNGYLTSDKYSDFDNKLTTVSHNNTLTGLGTVASPLKADTAIMAARAWVLNQEYITRVALDFDSLENAPPIPEISDIAYGGTWDGNLNGASKNSIYDKIESLAGGHDPITLTDTATMGGLSLVDDTTQVLDFQRASLSTNGFMDSYTFGQVAISAKAPVVFGTDNTIIRSDGTGRNVQKSVIATIDDTNNMELGGRFKNNGSFNIIAGAPVGGFVFQTRNAVAEHYKFGNINDGSIGDFIYGNNGTSGVGLFTITHTTGATNFYSLRGTGNRLVMADANGNITATKKDSISYWNTAYLDKVNSLAVTGTTTKTLTLTQQDGGTVTGTFTDLQSESTGKNMFIEGTVSGRNIDIDYPDYVPANGYMLHVLADASIASGTDTITLSINGADTATIFEYFSHDVDYALELVYKSGTWFLLMGKAEENFAKGINTGDQEISLYGDSILLAGSDSSYADLSGYMKKSVYDANTDNIINPTAGGTGQGTVATGELLIGYTTDTWVRVSPGEAGTILTSNGTTSIPSWETGICSQTVQTLSGSTDTLNVANGVNGYLDISGNTTIRIEPTAGCNTGNITILCEAAADSITFTSDYTLKVSPYLGLSNGKVPVTNGADTIDVYSYWFDGIRLIINGTKGYE